MALSRDKPQLPPELMIHTATFLEQDRDLATLCTVSKTFSILFTPILYRAVNIQRRTVQVKVQLRLYQTLRNPRFSCFVTEFSVSLGDTLSCVNSQSIFRLFGTKRILGKDCICQVHDRAFGDAILTMKRLKSLNVNCSLPCRGHSHEHLFHPDVPKLRRFSFRCYDARLQKSILQAPFMADLQAVHLECHAFMITPPHSTTLGELLRGGGFAPNLRTLQHGGHTISQKMLTQRPIQRLCVDAFTYRVHGAYAGLLKESIWISPGVLSHLLMVDLLQWLPIAMKETLRPYRNIQFIGTITGSHCEVNLFHVMKISRVLTQAALRTMLRLMKWMCWRH